MVTVPSLIAARWGLWLPLRIAPGRWPGLTEGRRFAAQGTLELCVTTRDEPDGGQMWVKLRPAAWTYITVSQVPSRALRTIASITRMLATASVSGVGTSVSSRIARANKSPWIVY